MNQNYPMPSFPRKRESSWLNDFSRSEATLLKSCPLRGVFDLLDSRFCGNDGLFADGAK
jgi:hypothetical protein